MADRKLFESQALVWMDAVYRAALALCGQPSLADDLAQSTYLKAWERFEQFAAGTNCRAWLLTILQNTWTDHLRRQGQVRWTGSEGLEQLAVARDRPDPPDWQRMDQALEQFSDPQLLAALARLPEEFRLALFLVDVEGYSHQEAAEVLGVAVGTVKSRTSRARQLLRERLGKPGDG